MAGEEARVLAAAKAAVWLGGRWAQDVCTCSKCGHQEPRDKRGVPCTQIKCPKCDTLMTGEFC